jgi:hypothetical protein
MARAVVLTFQDNSEAETFVRTLDILQKDVYAESPSYDALPDVLGRLLATKMVDGCCGVSIDAVIARPTRWCKCTPTQKRRGRQKPLGDYTRTPKFGWWVHALCMKPERPIVVNWVKNLLGGNVNLLEDILKKEEAA